MSIAPPTIMGCPSEMLSQGGLSETAWSLRGQWHVAKMRRPGCNKEK